MHTASNPFPENRSLFPRDLRGGGPNLAGAGNLYPVDPKAVARLRAYWQQQAAEKEKGATSMDQATAQKKTIRLIDPDAKEKVAALLEEHRTADNYNYAAELEAAIEQAEAAVLGASQKNKNGEGAAKMDKTEETVVYPTAKAKELYPAECIAAARHEMTKDNPRARRLAEVVTPTVVAVWLGWLDEGKSIDWIRHNNELLPVTFETVQRYIDKHRAAAERIRASRNGQSATSGTSTAISPPLQLAEEPIEPPAQTGTAPQPAPEVVPNTAESPPDPVPEPQTATMEAGEEPEIEPMETAVEPFIPKKPANLPPWLDHEYSQPRPSPGAALAALVELASDDQLQIEGTVELNLKIIFGGNS